MTKTKFAARLMGTGTTAILALVLGAPAGAQNGIQDLEQLDALVATALGAGIGQPGGARAPIDRRLKLKACPETPVVDDPVMNAVAVRCNPIGWRIRVPIAMAAGGQAARAEELAREGVKRGEPILLTVSRPSFTLSRIMIADRDGRVGDVIPVREDPRSQPIFVRIVEPGVATILSN